MSDLEIEALKDYDKLYYGMESEDESTGRQQDFCSPFQSSDRTLQIERTSLAWKENQQKLLSQHPLHLLAFTLPPNCQHFN